MLDWDSFEEKFPLIAKSLRYAGKVNRLPHSFLLVSSNPEYRLQVPPLIGALTACTDKRSDGAPCGKCLTCRTLANGMYPDLYVLEPTSKSRQIVIGDDDDDPDTLRNFDHNFYLSSTTASGWKIGVIRDCDAMNESAQNAFLKTLEEPPRNSMFILTTGRPSSLLPTIRSRCQTLSLTDNHVRYDGKAVETIAPVLFDLEFKAVNDIAMAEDCAERLTAILSFYRDEAEETVNARWADREEELKQLESAGAKLVDKRRDGEKGSEFRRLREQFVSIIHAWFAQIALKSMGSDDRLLPNPEVVSVYLAMPDRPKIREREAFRMLGEAEEFANVLRSNVSDELAIRSFVFNAAIK